MTSSSRERLLDAARALFAERGFSATSVGDIEEVAGFARRGGNFYRHFSSKEAVLDAVVDEHIRAVRETKALVELLPLDDRRSELRLIGRSLLRELDAEEAIHRILDKEGDRVDAARRAMVEGVLHDGYRQIAALFAGWIDDDHDVDALVVVLLGGLVNLRRNQWTFGAVPLDVDDDRALDEWVRVAEAALRGAQGTDPHLEAPPSPTGQVS